MFEIGELVVYGSAGVCEVTEISTLKLDDVDDKKLYYFLLPVGTNSSKIFTPIENQKIVMRPLISKEEAKEVLNEISKIEQIDSTNARVRELAYKECCRSCDCRELIRLIKSIRVRNQHRIASGKRYISMDERYLKKAEAALYQELSIVLETTKEEIDKKITEGLELVDLVKAE